MPDLGGSEQPSAAEHEGRPRTGHVGSVAPGPFRPRVRANAMTRRRSRLRVPRGRRVRVCGQVKSSSDKPWLAGRQPSDRGGVPQVRTWLHAPSRRAQQARVLLQQGPGPDEGPGAAVVGHRTTVTPHQPPSGADTRRRRA